MTGKNDVTATVRITNMDDLVVCLTKKKEIHLFNLRFSVILTEDVLRGINEKFAELKTNSGEREDG